MGPVGGEEKGNCSEESHLQKSKEHIIYIWREMASCSQ